MKPQDIIALIKRDHVPLRAGIKILKSEEATDSQKKKALKIFLRDLELHAKAEEKSLYESAQTESEVRSTILEGYEEHEIADALALELKALNFENEWNDHLAAKAKVLAELVEHHVEEEEREMLPEVEEVYSKEELLQLGEQYVQAYKEVQAGLALENIVPPQRKSAAESAVRH